MTKIRNITELFDERHEVAAWLVMLTAIVLLVTERLDQWPFVALIATSLVTLLGSQYFRGVRVGPSGIEVD